MTTNYQSGTVTATSTASALLIPEAVSGCIIYNSGSSTVYLGGPNVTADKTPTGGIPLPAGQSMQVPSTDNAYQNLYLICAAGNTTTVAYLAPGVI